MRRIGKLAHVVRGFASFDPLSRVKAAERLYAHFIDQLSAEQRDDYLEIASVMEDEALSEARVYSVTQSILPHLPKGGVVAEIGVLHGELSALIAEICRPDELHLFDIDFSPLREQPVRERMGDSPIFKYEGDSSTNLSKLPAGSFDWIYVDGDHSYEGVKKDVLAADRALRPGGLMLCNDYSNWCARSAMPYGVKKAVNEFIKQYDYKVLALTNSPTGLPDILLKKPG